MIPALNGKLFAGLYSFIALIMFVAFMPLPKGVDTIVNWISAYWMGVFVYLLLFFIIVDIVLSFLVVTKLVAKPISQRVQFNAGSIAIILTVIVVGYGIYNATKIRHVSYEVETSNEKNKEKMNIVLISDLHLGAVKSESRLEEMVSGINKQNPDLVVLAGDIFNDDFNDIKDPERAIELFKSIDATYGVYGSLGNHDGGATLKNMVDFLAKSNIQLLKDEYDIINDRFVLIGRLDPS
ncbi:MAG: metallophosphoesterase, partial [Lysinibacillus sp.]